MYSSTCLKTSATERRSALKNKVIALLKRLWNVLSRNIALKVISLLVALLLWNYVVTSDASLTRTKTVSNLTGYISGEATLTSNDLALAEDPTGLLRDITVVVEVAQSNYVRVSAENVQVMLDVTRVRTAGVHEVPLRATTFYGQVKEISPSHLTLNFETLDSRSVPVNVQLTGNLRDDLWYNVRGVNPSTITVSGAASVVQSIRSAMVYMDLSGANAASSYISARPYVLLDADGNEISQSMLSRSSTSITVNTEIYPSRDLQVASVPSAAVYGQPAEGYEVKSVSIQPSTITVAADADLLESLNELQIEPINVSGLSQTFSVRAGISSLSNFKYISSDEVYVTVVIGEIEESAWIDSCNINFIGKAENLSLTWDLNTSAILVTGPRSRVEALSGGALMASVDLTGLGPGEYDLPLIFPTDEDDGLSYDPAVPTVHVVLTAAEDE